MIPPFFHFVNVQLRRRNCPVSSDGTVQFSATKVFNSQRPRCSILPPYSCLYRSICRSRLLYRFCSPFCIRRSSFLQVFAAVSSTERNLESAALFFKKKSHSRKRRQKNSAPAACTSDCGSLSKGSSFLSGHSEKKDINHFGTKGIRIDYKSNRNTPKARNRYGYPLVLKCVSSVFQSYGSRNVVISKRSTIVDGYRFYLVCADIETIALPKRPSYTSFRKDWLSFQRENSLPIETHVIISAVRAPP